MSAVQSSTNFVEIVQTSGPFVVAIVSIGFGFWQSKKVAEINKEKDLEIAHIEQQSSFELEKHKNYNTALLRLQELYSPLYAKLEALIHTYIGLVANERVVKDIKWDLNEYVVDEHLSIPVNFRKGVMAEAIVICQILQDQKAYRMVVDLDRKINRVMSLIDFSGSSCGSQHVQEINQASDECSLIYVAFFYRIANMESLKSDES